MTRYHHINGVNVKFTPEEEAARDAEEAAWEAEYAANGYKLSRAEAFPSVENQLDYIYHHGVDKWKTDVIDPIKKKYPKPE